MGSIGSSWARLVIYPILMIRSGPENRGICQVTRGERETAAGPPPTNLNECRSRRWDPFVSYVTHPGFPVQAGVANEWAGLLYLPFRHGFARQTD